MDLISDPDRREGSKVKWLGFNVVGKSLPRFHNPKSGNIFSFFLLPR